MTHDGHTNTYSFLFNNTKVVLLPSRDVNKFKHTGDSTNLLSLTRFKEEMRDTGTIYVLLGKDAGEEIKIPKAAVSFIEEFGDIFPNELPDGLTTLRDIHYQINSEPGAMLPNRPHYRMSPSEYEEL